MDARRVSFVETLPAALYGEWVSPDDQQFINVLRSLRRHDAARWDTARVWGALVQRPIPTAVIRSQPALLQP